MKGDTAKRSLSHGRSQRLPHHPKMAGAPSRLAATLSPPTPNGVKVSIMLEGPGLPNEVHRVEFSKDDEADGRFFSLNPQRQAPGCSGPERARRATTGLFEFGAILLFLAEKTGKFLTEDSGRPLGDDRVGLLPDGVYRAVLRAGRLLPEFAGREIEDKRPLKRYVDESARRWRAGRAVRRANLVMGDDYTIADIATLGWVRNLVGFYGAGDLVGFDWFHEVAAGFGRPRTAGGGARADHPR